MIQILQHQLDKDIKNDFNNIDFFSKPKIITEPNYYLFSFFIKLIFSLQLTLFLNFL